MKFRVASSASSTAAVSESCVRLPAFSVSMIDVIDDCQVVIDEQSPSAHSVVGVVSLLESLEPQPAARSAHTATTCDEGQDASTWR